MVSQKWLYLDIVSVWRLQCAPLIQLLMKLQDSFYFQAPLKAGQGFRNRLHFSKKLKLLSSAFFRPSYRAVQYYREGTTVSDDTLWTYRYTPRFVMMLDVKTLRLPASLNIPVLVGVGDKDELFAIDKVKDFYNLVPGNKKEFFVMQNATHAKIPVEGWQEVVAWLNKTYAG